MNNIRPTIAAVFCAAAVIARAGAQAPSPAAALPLQNLGLEHLDIVVPDPAAAARFYGQVFKAPLHQQQMRDGLRYFVVLGDVPADRQVGYVAIGAADGRPVSIGHYCVLAKVYDRAGMGRAMESGGWPAIRASAGLGVWPDPDGLELQLFQPPAGLVTAAVPSPLAVERQGFVVPRALDHVLLRVSNMQRSRQYYRLLYGEAVERPPDSRGRVWLHLDKDTRVGLQQANAGQSPAIEHFAIKVAPFDRNALTARLKELGARIVASDDEPDVFRFQDNNGIVVELRTVT